MADSELDERNAPMKAETSWSLTLGAFYEEGTPDNWPTVLSQKGHHVDEQLLHG